jgi:moderate conductance mechanosensitive channel
MNLAGTIERIQELLGDFFSPVVSVTKIVGILILAMVVIKIGSFFIKKIFEKQKKFKFRLNDKRLDTMSTLLLSIFRYTIYLIAIVTILTDVFNLKSVLAAAGIGGIAIGLGAQSLIKDVISGFFIILEDQFVVGDLITVDTLTGTVEHMELRVTRIRNFNGDLHIIPNGDIRKVTNHTRGDKAVMVDIPVSNNADMDEAFAIADDVCTAVAKEFETLVEAPKVLGITELGKDSLTLRIIARTLPNEQWEVERRIRKLIREGFSKGRIDPSDKQKLVISDGLPKGGNTDG